MKSYLKQYAEQVFFPVLTLFTSASTLICCALPALFVALGMGATLVGLTTAFPQLIWISERKLLVFSVAGVLLVLAGYGQWQARRLPCPVDPVLAKWCTKLRFIGRIIYIFSVILYLIGAFFAFMAKYLL